MQRLDIGLIAQILEALTLRNFFPDFSSSQLLIDMEQFLRFLAFALRLYKYHSKSLEQTVHQTVYKRISDLWNAFEKYRDKRNPKYRVDDWNIAFLIKHCQYILLSIESSESFNSTPVPTVLFSTVCETRKDGPRTFVSKPNSSPSESVGLIQSSLPSR